MASIEWRLAGMGLVGLLLGPGATAAVTASDAGGFTVTQERRIAAPAGRAFDALLDIGSWWDPAHTLSGDASNLSLEPRAGGCFCEKLGKKGQVRHMEVLLIEPGVRLRLGGGLGPLQELAVAGSMSIDLAESGEETVLTLTYRVAGWQPGGLESWSGPVDRVLGEQLDRLKRLLETGDPAAG